MLLLNDKATRNEAIQVRQLPNKNQAATSVLCKFIGARREANSDPITFAP